MPATSVRIEPSETTVEVGRQATLRVLAQRGGRDRPLTKADGVELHVADPSIATAGDNLSVRGRRRGTTEVSARLGSLRAAAKLNVIRK